jgi:hypothetical protein
MLNVDQNVTAVAVATVQLAPISSLLCVLPSGLSYLKL